MPQRYKEFLIYANKNGFFDEKYRIESDFNGRNGLAGVAARSRQLGVTTGIQCRDNRQSETGITSPTNRQNRNRTAGSGRYTPHGLRPH